jgi:hypothetical protein
MTLSGNNPELMPLVDLVTLFLPAGEAAESFAATEDDRCLVRAADEEGRWLRLETNDASVLASIARDMLDKAASAR